MRSCLCTDMLSLYWKCSVNPSAALDSHDWNRVWNFYSNIHERRPALHHLCASSFVPGIRTRPEQPRCKRGVNGGEKKINGDKHERKRTRDREIEKMGSWCSTRASVRLLSLPSRQTWLHHSVPVCRYDLTRAPEPTPSGISLEQPNTFMQVAPQLCGNLQQSYKLFSSLW